MKKQLTLAYLIDADRICLALKKRGFGEGNWNGFGGKVEDGESIAEATVRELKEESTVGVSPDDLEPASVIEFHFKDGKHLEVFSFFVRRWDGEPRETEEMRPAWFSFSEIPLDKMWADDEHWLPRALRGERLRGVVRFSGDGRTIESMEWTAVAMLP
ncbi:MAG TPA: 8-oxo-dGTP diphosphatase [Candidatus Paceibacterota bacterium]|nr:8-oxo-dGTP diphosphatase [Candidatus Paceibacterota bacterium]